MCPAMLAYHADAEIARAETVARLALFAGVALVGLLAATRGDPDGGRNDAARLALALAGVGIAAWLVWRLLPTDEADGGWATLWYLLAGLMLVAALAAPALAAAACRPGAGGEPRLRAAALAASLVLPAAALGSVVACLVTEQCFH